VPDAADLFHTVDYRFMGAIHRAKKLRKLQFKLARARDHLGTYYQFIDELPPNSEEAFRDLPHFREQVALWQGYIAQFSREIADLLAFSKELNREYSR